MVETLSYREGNAESRFVNSNGDLETSFVNCAVDVTHRVF